MVSKIVYTFLALMLPLVMFATHNRAGEITYRVVGELRIEITVSTYTKASSTQADRDSVEVDFGDGIKEFVKRTNGDGQILDNNVQYNTYVTEHQYPGEGTYTISLQDPNRVAQIQNVNFGNSENIRFYIETTFTFPNIQFTGPNNSVQLLQSPIDLACIGKKFVHLPNAFDKDGDSLAFELIVPLSEAGVEVPNYELPSAIVPGTNNSFSFNTSNGEIVWESPQKQGEYNVAFRVKEYRKGVLINSMIRDMQIFVFSCNNDPPIVETIEEICVVAGETVSFDVFVNDPNMGDLVKIEATGGPFLAFPNAAVFNAPAIFQEVPFSATFTWETTCEDIASDYYQVVFRAVDNFFGSGSGLADLKAVRIKVSGPPPEDLQVENTADVLNLSWELPYMCDTTDYLIGFSVWRSEGSVALVQDTCSPGLSNTAYSRISNPELVIDNGRYYYQDAEVEKGRTYCYRVEAEFARLTSAGFPFNFVESLASEEVCMQLKRDIPLLTHVDVQITDPINGQIYLDWIKPNAEDFDTLANVGPYRYELERADGVDGNNFVPITSSSVNSPFFGSTVDLSFVDTGLNTSDQAYRYRVAFYTANGVNFYDYSPNSSSVYLSSIGTDMEILLEWTSQTSWNNELYYILKYNEFDMAFELIDSTSLLEYKDVGLKNGDEYCYQVRSKGSYNIAEVISPLLNHSNENCDIPIDSIPPCIPEIMVSNLCDQLEDTTPEEDFVNTIRWQNVKISCTGSNDTYGYNIYIKKNDSGNIEFIDFNLGADNTTFEHKPEDGLVACYLVTSVDSVGNESNYSQEVCISDCPSYILPNVFTPNGDGANDIFKPLLNRFVSSIDMHVFTERGQKIFDTSDPDILWDGTDYSGNILPDGVYFYTCQVNRTNVSGTETNFSTLSGYIEIIKSQ